jgi:two-component system sensor histidine kinase RegB
MPSSHRLRWDPVWGFHALAVAFVAIGGWHLLTETEGLGTALETFIIVALATVPFYTGVEIRRDGSVKRARRALNLTLVTVVALSLLAVAVAVIWTLEGTRPEDASFMVRFAGALGVAFGSRGGLMTVRSERSYERATELNRLLKMNQRVLRHDLRNELAVVVGHLDNVESRLDDDPDVARIREHVTELLDSSEHARRIVDVWEIDDRAEFDLPALVARARDQVAERHPDAAISLHVPEGCRVRAHLALDEAVAELLANAVEHNPPDVSVSVTAVRRGEQVFLEVADTGVGLQRKDREAVFLTEETPLSHARGLGLLFVYWVVAGSDGELVIDDFDEGGTAVRVRLPAA